MMAYIMRYPEELRDPATYFDDIKKVSVDEDQLSLAKELIKRKTAKFAPEKFKDDYEVALKELVEAKVKNEPLPKEEPARKTGKVINLMDALRKSVQGGSAPANVHAKKTASAGANKGLSLVKPKSSAKTHKRKSA
jgi:DNA end-binding protein Ku